jgi:hypothetical protein
VIQQAACFVGSVIFFFRTTNDAEIAFCLLRERRDFLRSSTLSSLHLAHCARRVLSFPLLFIFSFFFFKRVTPVNLASLMRSYPITCSLAGDKNTQEANRRIKARWDF